MNLYLIAAGFIFSVCCGCKSKTKLSPETVKMKPVVILQPLEFTDSAALLQLKDSVEQFYDVTVYINSNKSFPGDLFYKPRNRYRADRIIHWLRMNMPDSVRTIVGITSKDVSTTKTNAYDYGVMGLGYRPGNACVVSTFRPAKTAKNKKHLQERLYKLVIHEMGHNFGLPHCSNEACFMVDAEGQMKLDNERFLCDSCKRSLKL
jgi:archaemetzincin